MIIFKIWCHPTDRRKREEYKENDFFKDELPYLVTREYLETFLVESVVSPLVLMMLYHWASIESSKSVRIFLLIFHSSW